MVSRTSSDLKVPKRILNNLLISLESGVVPRSGAPYIAIGRNEEIKSLKYNMELVSDGGAFARFIIGRYGSGKSFLIQLIRGNALDEQFLCMDVDLSPERKLYGAGGIATYRELIKNFSCKSLPDGGALQLLLDTFYNQLLEETSKKEQVEIQNLFHQRSKDLTTLVGGFDFIHVLDQYYFSDNEDVKNACIKWLRGEYLTKTDAKKELQFPVGCIINDANWYDFLKIWALSSKMMGYKGLLVFVDECINLYKIPYRISREANYEKILAIFNDTLQGRANYLGFLFGGTPQFLEDTRRGLFSYDALKSRLQDSKYVELGYVNSSSPVIRLKRLSDNELVALLRRLYYLFLQKEQVDLQLKDEDFATFFESEMHRAGSNELITPREFIRDFLSLLQILKDHPDVHFDTLCKKIEEETKPQVEEESHPNEEEPTPKATFFDFNL